MATEKNELAIASREEFFNAEQRKMIRDSFLAGVGDTEAKVLLEVAAARGLNPILGQIHYVQRWDSSKKTMRMAYQVGIDGLRLIANRSGLYDGQDEPEYELDEAQRPILCRVKVYRKDWSRPVVGVAHWAEYVQTTKEGQVTSMWKNKPRLMLAKCAEALALRKAFPNDAGDLYTAEEMAAEVHIEPPAQASAALPAQNDRIKAAVARAAPKAEAVDAIFTETPKPAAPPSPPPFALTAEPTPEPSAPVPTEREPGDDSEPSPVVPFGKNKGMKLSELNEKQLVWYFNAATENVADPAKEKFRAKEQVWLNAISEEMAKRGGA